MSIKCYFYEINLPIIDAIELRVKLVKISNFLPQSRFRVMTYEVIKFDSH